MFKFSKKSLSATVAAAAVVIGGGAAWAWISASGVGIGSAETGSVPVITSVVAQPAGPIVDLDSPVDVNVTVTADKAGARVSSLTLGVDTTSPSAMAFWAANPTCLPAWFVTTNSSPAWAGGEVATAPGSTFLGSVTGVTIQLRDEPVSQNGCMGLTGIPLSISVG